MDPMTEPNPSNRGRLAALRIIWAALLMGQVNFLGVIFFVLWPNQSARRQPDPMTMRMLLYVAGGMLVAAILGGYIIRSMMYGPRQSDGSIHPARYASGNIILWAMSEGVAFLALVSMMMDQKPWPFLGIALVAMANQVINFPTGYN
jgi:hypothetical protein